MPEETEAELESEYYEDNPAALDEVPEEPGDTYLVKIDGEESEAVSYTHLTLPTILLV